MILTKLQIEDALVNYKRGHVPIEDVMGVIKVHIEQAFEAGHKSARMNGSYKRDGTFMEDLKAYIQSINPQ